MAPHQKKHEEDPASPSVLSPAEVEQKLKHLLLLSRLIDAPVENENDWQARTTCEELFCQIDEELRAAQVHFSYCERAGRYLRERYRMVEDGSFEERGRGRVVCWTLMDTEANEGQGAPVLVAAPMTPQAVQVARALGLPLPTPFPCVLACPCAQKKIARVLKPCVSAGISPRPICVRRAACVSQRAICLRRKSRISIEHNYVAFFVVRESGVKDALDRILLLSIPTMI